MAKSFKEKRWIIYDNWAKSAGHYLNDTYTKNPRHPLGYFFSFPTEVSTELTGMPNIMMGVRSPSISSINGGPLMPLSS